LQKNVSIDAEPEEGHAPLEIEDAGATPFEQLASLEIQGAVQAALAQVPDVFRSAVILRTRRFELRRSRRSFGMQRRHSEVPHFARPPLAEDLLDPLLGDSAVRFTR